MRKFLIALLAALAVVAGSGAPAMAHKVVASAWADGADIEGEVGFSNGDMAPAASLVEVFGPDGAKLGETEVDDEGVFRFTPTQPVPHTFRVDMGAGHVAETTLSVEELPIALRRQAEGGAAAAPAAAPAAPVSGSAVTAGNVDLEAMIEEAVRREVRPLRRDIAASEEKHDLQSLIGGLGYIAGIFGLLFFVAGWRRSKAKA